MVSGPSGAGKDSLVDELRRIEPNLAYSISATTRAPRQGEQEGVHYYFTSRSEFERMASEGAFIETREYANNLYGTPRRFVEDALASGRDIVMKPEVNGAMAIKRAFPQAVLVFLTAPSERVLAQRLKRRSTDSKDSITKRLEIARAEAGFVSAYEYLIVNDSLPEALAKLHAVLAAERLKVSRLREKIGGD